MNTNHNLSGLESLFDIEFDKTEGQLEFIEPSVKIKEIMILRKYKKKKSSNINKVLDLLTQLKNMIAFTDKPVFYSGQQTKWNSLVFDKIFERLEKSLNAPTEDERYYISVFKKEDIDIIYKNRRLSTYQCKVLKNSLIFTE